MMGKKKRVKKEQIIITLIQKIFFWLSQSQSKDSSRLAKRRGSRGASDQDSLVAGVQPRFKSYRKLLGLYGSQYGPDGSQQC
jgi:hypothetical protein